MDLTKTKGDCTIGQAPTDCGNDHCLQPSLELQGILVVPRYDRLSILVSLFLFGIVVSHVVELPTQTISFVALGVPTTVYLSGRWLVGVLLVIMTGAGVDSIVRSHPAVGRAGWAYTLSFWGLPCALVLLSLVVLPISPHIMFWLGSLALTGLLLALIVAAQQYTIDGQGRHIAVMRWGLDLAVYAAVFLFCALIYGARVRSLLSATAVSVLGVLMAAELLRPPTPETPMRRTWLYSAIVGLVLGEVAWALNHMSLGAVGAGIIFLLVFYVLAGLAKQHLAGTLARPVIAEFVLVSILGLGLLYLM
jgi:hypothetical protein